MFVPKPHCQSDFIYDVDSSRLAALQMIQQRSRIDMHLMQWLKTACHQRDAGGSIVSALHDVAMGRVIGCEAITAFMMCQLQKLRHTAFAAIK